MWLGVQCRKCRSTAIFCMFKRLQTVPYTVGYIIGVPSSAACIRQYIRHGAQPYKQHTLRSALTESRTKAVKVSMVPMPNWAEPTELILAFAEKKRTRSIANAAAVTIAAIPEMELRNHGPQTGVSPTKKAATASTSAVTWSHAKTTVISLTKSWGIWKGKWLPTRVLISFFQSGEGNEICYQVEWKTDQVRIHLMMVLYMLCHWTIRDNNPMLQIWRIRWSRLYWEQLWGNRRKGHQTKRAREVRQQLKWLQR